MKFKSINRAPDVKTHAVRLQSERFSGLLQRREQTVATL